MDSIVLLFTKSSRIMILMYKLNFFFQIEAVNSYHEQNICFYDPHFEIGSAAQCMNNLLGIT